MKNLKQKSVNLLEVLTEQLTQEHWENEDILEAVKELKEAVSNSTPEILPDILEKVKQYERKQKNACFRVELYCTGDGYLYDVEEGTERINFNDLQQLDEFLEEQLKEREPEFFTLTDEEGRTIAVIRNNENKEQFENSISQAVKENFCADDCQLKDLLNPENYIGQTKGITVILIDEEGEAQEQLIRIESVLIY